MTPSAAALNAALALSVLFMAFLIWNLMRDLVRGERETSERVFGALSAYLFLGIMFALVYTNNYHQNPAAFTVPDAVTADHAGSDGFMFTTFLYFSFVTLTTLGYGDITPTTDHTRTLVYIEALMGQLFLAVMVAGLVGVSFAEAAARGRKSRAEPHPDHSDGEKPGGLEDS
jgi:hypothetical protein